jgi:hypothetical protein
MKLVRVITSISDQYLMEFRDPDNGYDSCDYWFRLHYIFWKFQPWFIENKYFSSDWECRKNVCWVLMKMWCKDNIFINEQPAHYVDVKPGCYPPVPNRMSCEGDWRGCGFGLKQVFLVDRVVPPKTYGLTPKTQKKTPLPNKALVWFLAWFSLNLLRLGKGNGGLGDTRGSPNPSGGLFYTGIGFPWTERALIETEPTIFSVPCVIGKTQVCKPCFAKPKTPD